MEILKSLGKGILCAIVFCSVLTLVCMAYFALTTTPGAQRLIPNPKQKKIQIERLLQENGLAGQVKVVEIHKDGSLWYEKGGELCRLKR